FLEDYIIFSQPVRYAKIGAYSLFLSIGLIMYIIEKFFLNMTVAYLGNNVFTNRIGSINLKFCIIHRLLIFANSIRTRNPALINNELLTGVDVTDSFLIDYEDLKIKTLQH